MAKFCYVFLIVAVVSAVFGFGGFATISAQSARVLAIVFGLLFVACLLMYRRK